MALVFSFTVHAQSTSSLQGTVKDEAGQPIDGATIKLGNQTVTASEAGNFIISSVPAGKHKLIITAVGF